MLANRQFPCLVLMAADYGDDADKRRSIGGIEMMAMTGLAGELRAQ